MAAMSVHSLSAQLAARPAAASSRASSARFASRSAVRGVRLSTARGMKVSTPAGLAGASRGALRASRLRVEAAGDGSDAKAVEKDDDEKGQGIRQLLGVRGGSRTDDIWKIRLQLTKPVTWVPLIWGVMCGAAASGHYTWTFDNVGKAMLCMFMSGPLLTGETPPVRARPRAGARG